MSFEDFVDGVVTDLVRVKDLETYELPLSVEVENHLRLNAFTLDGLLAWLARQRQVRDLRFSVLVGYLKKRFTHFPFFLASLLLTS